MVESLFSFHFWKNLMEKDSSDSTSGSSCQRNFKSILTLSYHCWRRQHGNPMLEAVSEPQEVKCYCLSKVEPESFQRELGRVNLLALDQFLRAFPVPDRSRKPALVHLLVTTVSSIVQHWNLFSLDGQWGWVKEGWLCKANYVGFPDSSVGKESTCHAGDPGWIPGSEDLLVRG